jgi:hypothetical protein
MRSLGLWTFAALCFAGLSCTESAVAQGDWWARSQVFRSKYYNVRTDFPDDEVDTLDFSRAESAVRRVPCGECRAESAVRIALHFDRNQPQRIGAGDNWLRLSGTIERDLAFAGLGQVWSLDEGPQHRRR